MEANFSGQTQVGLACDQEDILKRVCVGGRKR